MKKTFYKYILGGRIYDSLKSTDWSDIGNILLTTSAVIAGAILAFSMEVMEFLVVTYTSSLTLSISGIFKVNDDIYQFHCASLHIMYINVYGCNFNHFLLTYASL